MNAGELHRRMEEGITPWVSMGGGDMEEDFTIVRLPSHCHLTNQGLYEPRLVSIGPYHLDSESTRGMQCHKSRFLCDFLARKNRDGGTTSLAACIKEVRAMEARARCCYAEPPELGSDDFVQLLVLDGCFILEFLLKYLGSRVGGRDDRKLDAYMQPLWVYVYYDLLLIENQIPFFVIEKLFDTATPMVKKTLLALITDFFSLREPLPRVQPIKLGHVHHLLHLRYQMMIPVPEQQELGWSKLYSVSSMHARMTGSTRTTTTTATTTTPLTIPCAVELQEEFGITFREKAAPASQFDVTFRGGRMEIPRLAIDNGTGILLANLLAQEQTRGLRGALTSYVVLMNALMNTGADATVLQRRGVLDNMLSSEEDAAAFFNRLGGCALFDPADHHYTALFKDTNRYCDSRWNRYMALLKRNHLRSPCTVIKLLVAAILLCMSALSGSYVIYRLLHNSSP